jgi:hypothetical protein
MLQVSFSNVSSVFLDVFVSVFMWMFHMFHTYVVSVLSDVCVCLQWLSSVSFVFRRMLQPLHLNVSKLDQVFAHCHPLVAAARGGHDLWVRRGGQAGCRRHMGSAKGVDAV